MDNKTVFEILNENLKTETEATVETNVPDDDKHFIAFESGLKKIYQSTRATEIKLLLKMIEKAIYNTNVLFIPASIRRKWMEELNISKSAFAKAIKYLLDEKFIAGEKGEYCINPRYFWKGDLKTINDYFERVKSNENHRI